MGDLPAVTIILLNWNAAPYLGDALASLLAQDYPAFELVVVDNGSTDGSPALVRERFPAVRLIPLAHNPGFAAGNNAALRQLTTELAVLVNPDVVAPPGWLRGLVQPLLDDPAIGIAGGLLTFGDGVTIQHAGGRIHPPRARSEHIGLGERLAGQYDRVQDVDYVIGAALALRRELLERIGLLDEGFFLYFEDVDLCWRARRAGYRVVYAPGPPLVHLESVLTARGSPGYLRQMHNGRWRFLLKHYPAEMILGETLPAERAWLATAGGAQQRAAAWAYYAARRGLPAILAARARDGAPPLAAAAQAALAAGLIDLLAQAWQLGHGGAGPVDGVSGADQLLARAVVEERPFRSSLPLIGPLVAGFRALWNRVATRDYFRPQLAQQNAFNQLAARQIAHYERWLAAEAAALPHVEAQFAPRLLPRARGEASLTGPLAQLQADLAATRRRLAAIEQRLAALGAAGAGDEELVDGR